MFRPHKERQQVSISETASPSEESGQHVPSSELQFPSRDLLGLEYFASQIENPICMKEELQMSDEVGETSL